LDLWLPRVAESKFEAENIADNLYSDVAITIEVARYLFPTPVTR